MIIFGIILLILGLILALKILWILGIILVIAGIVVFATRPGGRHYY